MRLRGKFALPDPSFLAFRAVVAASSPNYNPLDGSSANQARLPFPSIDPVLQLEEALPPVGIDVVGYRGTAKRNRLSEHLLHRRVELPQLLTSDARPPPPRPDARPEQRLIGVNVPHPAQELLVQESALHRRLAPSKQVYKPL